MNNFFRFVCCILKFWCTLFPIRLEYNHVFLLACSFIWSFKVAATHYINCNIFRLRKKKIVLFSCTRSLLGYVVTLLFLCLLLYYGIFSSIFLWKWILQQNVGQQGWLIYSIMHSVEICVRCSVLLNDYCIYKKLIPSMWFGVYCSLRYLFFLLEMLFGELDLILGLLLLVVCSLIIISFQNAWEITFVSVSMCF